MPCLFVIAVLLLGATTQAHASVIFFEEFADNSAGWTLGLTWEIGPADGSGPPSTGCPSCGFNPDPALDHTATANNGVAGVVIGGNYPTNPLHDYYWLTSPVVDTTGYTGVTFSFWRWLNSDYPTYVTSAVEVWTGSAWQSLWVQPNNSQVITDGSWNQSDAVFDITPYQSIQTQVRFGYKIESGGAYDASGWNVDDVSITGTPIPEPASLLLLGTGLVGAGARRWRKSRGKS